MNWSGGRRWATAAAFALAVLAGLLPGQPLPTASAAGTVGPCTDNVGVTVVVDFQELGGGVQVRCTVTPPTTGLQALTLAGFTWTGTQQNPAFVCRIQGLPTAGSDPCNVPSPTSAYWSYWLAPRSGGWCYATLGGNDRVPPAGSVEGWSFSLNRTTTTAPKPRFRPPPAIAGQAPNPISPGHCSAPAKPWPAAVSDFDDDGTTDPAVYRPSTGTWFVDGSAPVAWGNGSDVPASADYDGDGDVERAVFRPSNGTWYVAGGATTPWGRSGDIPVPGDYDGDGDAEVAVFRPSNGTWYVAGGPTIQWGAAGDVPVPGDYDGDGDTDRAVFRKTTGTWYVHGGATVAWGGSADVPVPGDHDADGDTDIAIYRPSNFTWYVRGGTTTAWGGVGDLPVPGDYDGDGTIDPAVFRPSTGAWYAQGVAGTITLGTTGDRPIPRPAGSTG